MFLCAIAANRCARAPCAAPAGLSVQPGCACGWLLVHLLPSSSAYPPLTRHTPRSCYGASILIRSYTWAELRSSLPWLIGSLGTVALDVAIYVQSRALGGGGGEPKHHPSDEDEPLLPEEAA